MALSKLPIYCGIATFPSNRILTLFIFSILDMKSYSTYYHNSLTKNNFNILNHSKLLASDSIKILTLLIKIKTHSLKHHYL